MCEKNAVQSGKRRQYTAAIMINLSAVATGLSWGWSSPITPQLLDDTTPISEPMTEYQVTWLSSIFCISPLFALPLCSTLSERFGRKLLACLIAVPMGLSWLLTLVAKDFTCLLIARILGGMSVGMAIFIVPIYVAEIASDDVRGKLGSFLLAAFNFGILLGFVFGVVMSYQMFAICGLLITIAFITGFGFMPETPIYLLRKDCEDQAIRSLMWFWNNDKRTVDSELQRLQDIVKVDSKSEESVSYKDLYRDRGTIMGVLIGIALLSAQATSGIIVVFMYTSTIFRLAGSSMDPDSAAIVLGAIQLVGSFLSTLTFERAGRKTLLIGSCLGMAIAHFFLGLFFLFQQLDYDVSQFGWFPVTVLSLYTVLFSLGLGPVSFVVAAEVVSSDISGLANSVAGASLWITSFVVMEGFTAINDAIGSYGCFFFFALLCMCTSAFTYFFVPETKGRSIESIVAELNGPVKGVKRSDASNENAMKV